VELKRGTIGFSRKRKNWVSRIITFWTKSKWSHTFIVYQTNPEILILEAGRYQVQLVPIKKYLRKSKYDLALYEPEGFDDEAMNRGLTAAWKKVENSYGWGQILGFVFMGLFRRNPIRAGVICSELVLLALRGFEPQAIWDAMDKDSVSPEDLFAPLDGHPKFKMKAL